MIDPNNITKYDRTDKELLEFWLFCILVAGKKSSWAANKVAELDRIFGIEVLFQLDKVLIKNMLMLCSAGQYERISNAIHESKSIDLRKAGFLELMQIKGCGPKTAAFFLTHSREGESIPILDTHILKYIRSKDTLHLSKLHKPQINTINWAGCLSSCQIRITQICPWRIGIWKFGNLTPRFNRIEPNISRISPNKANNVLISISR